MSFRTSSAALLSTLCFAIGAGACGGISPSSPGTTNPAESDPPTTAIVVPPEPSTPTPAPKYPIGPYTGAVATTDVSILYPLAASASSTAIVRPVASGPHGALLPRATFDTVLAGNNRLDGTARVTGFDALGLISVRLDPCSRRGSGGDGACRSEVRMVFQELFDKLPNEGPDTSSGTAATDGALHVVYDVPQEELVTMLRELLTLKKANGDLGLQQLAPHPILTAQGLDGAFGQGLRGILLEHLGDDRVARVTFFDHQDLEGDVWNFGVFDRSPSTGAFVPTTIPTTTSAMQQFSGSNTAGPLPQSFAQTSVPTTSSDSLALLLDSSRPAPGAPTVASLQPTLDAALRLQNPKLRNVETTDCVSCHQAEGASQIGEHVYALSTSSAFTHLRSLARVDERTSVTNVHAFGYLRRQVSIMQRTANESVLVADQMETMLHPPK